MCNVKMDQVTRLLYWCVCTAVHVSKELSVQKNVTMYHLSNTYLKVSHRLEIYGTKNILEFNFFICCNFF